MYCKYCGKQNADGAKFCAACGKPITVVPTTRPEPKKTPPSKSVIALVVVLVLLLLVGVAFGWAVATDRIHLGASQQTVEESDDAGTEPDGASSAQSEGYADSTVSDEAEAEEDAEISNDTSAESSAAAPEEEEPEDEPETEGSDASPLTSAYADDRSYYGNSFENSSQGGTMVASGDWIYYVSQNNNFSIWKMRTDGTEQTLVSSTSARHISMLGDYLYYRALGTGYLHRLNVETGSDTVLVARDIYEPKVVGSYIYYEDQSDDSYDLYRCDLDGSNEVRITDGVVFYCCVTDTRIYYVDTRDGRRGFSVALDGSDKQLWFDGRVGGIDYVDGTVYFTDMDNGGLYKMEAGTSTYTLMSSMTMQSINIYDGWIYFSNPDNGGALTKANLSNISEVVILSTADCELINVCGGWVQYHADGGPDDDDYYWVPTDGGAVVQF
ncbi:MAG: DUF5050 domain-containing protein [Clostridiales bacterium]|nr:DUF5050 domain-containing protein [Clostridiales bacterium]